MATPTRTTCWKSKKIRVFPEDAVLHDSQTHNAQLGGPRTTKEAKGQKATKGTTGNVSDRSLSPSSFFSCLLWFEFCER